MVTIIDANILISASLNPFGQLSKIIYTSLPQIEFIIPEFALTEIKLHAEHICNHTGIELKIFISNLHSLSENILIFSDDSVSKYFFNKAKIITTGVDIKDAIYIAFALSMDVLLWTAMPN
jgi:predicted nucleic acid-binding protein